MRLKHCGADMTELPLVCRNYSDNNRQEFQNLDIFCHHAVPFALILFDFFWHGLCFNRSEKSAWKARGIPGNGYRRRWLGIF
jgi:hypothetical protein